MFHAPNLTKASDTNDLLRVADFSTWSKADRWQLIDLIEHRIDYVQTQQSALTRTNPTYQFMASQLQALRLKRFRIWNSFYPEYNGQIQAGAGATPSTPARP